MLAMKYNPLIPIAKFDNIMANKTQIEAHEALMSGPLTESVSYIEKSREE